jgi:hypothetical protein
MKMITSPFSASSSTLVLSFICHTMPKLSRQTLPSATMNLIHASIIGMTCSVRIAINILPLVS